MVDSDLNNAQSWYAVNNTQPLLKYRYASDGIKSALLLNFVIKHLHPNTSVAMSIPEYRKAV